MARAVESVVFVLDVGPRMHPHLAQAARATADFITEKIVHKAKHQVCLLLFGASETRNRENDKSALEEGGEAEYSHIVEAHGLGPPDGDYIRTLHTLAPGHGHSDFKEALAVAAAVLVEQEGFRGTRRIVLLSNLCSRAQEDPEDALTSVLAEGLQQREIALEVVHLDVEEDDRQYDADKTYNLNQLAAICQELSHHERHFASGVALLSAFKFKEVSASATFSGHLAVGTKLHIPVKLCGKTAKEKLLTPGKESPDAENASEGAETGIQRDTEYYYADQEAHGYDVVPEMEVAKALRYGCNLVPFGDEQKQVFVFPTVRGLQLVGFVSAGHIPRHYYMKDVKVLVADKASPGGCAAMAALVAALLRQSQQAIIRFVSRNDSQPKLLLASPVAGSVAAVPHLLLNELPFMEDMRSYQFSSFTKKAWAPTQAQLDVAADLVRCMDLGAGGIEQLQPEATADPALHRLYWECGRRVVTPGVPLEEEDELAQEVLHPHPERLPGAAAALAAAAAAFPMHQAAKERRRAAVRIGLDDPLQDYARLKVEDGLTTEALEALQAAISELTLKSSGPHKLHTVVELVDVLRDDCIVHDQPQLFNTFLTELEARCQADDSKREVWRRLCRREIKLICKKEAAGSELEEQQTQEWYSQHLMQ